MDSSWETIPRPGRSCYVPQKFHSLKLALQDLWTHTNNGTVVRDVTIKNVPQHGVIALLLKDAGDEPAGTLPPCARPEWCMDQNGTRIDI